MNFLAEKQNDGRGSDIRDHNRKVPSIMSNLASLSEKQRLGVTLNPSLHIETKELPYCHHKAI